VEIVHAAQLDAAIERRTGETAHLDAGLAGPQRRLGMGGDLFMPVRRPDRDEQPAMAGLPPANRGRSGDDAITFPS
jgi:hypothetical protein